MIVSFNVLYHAEVRKPRARKLTIMNMFKEEILDIDEDDRIPEKCLEIEYPDGSGLAYFTYDGLWYQKYDEAINMSFMSVQDVEDIKDAVDICKGEIIGSDIEKRILNFNMWTKKIICHKNEIYVPVYGPYVMTSNIKGSKINFFNEVLTDIHPFMYAYKNYENRFYMSNNEYNGHYIRLPFNLIETIKSKNKFKYKLFNKLPGNTQLSEQMTFIQNVQVKEPMAFSSMTCNMMKIIIEIDDFIKNTVDWSIEKLEYIIALHKSLIELFHNSSNVGKQMKYKLETLELLLLSEKLR